MRRVEALQRRCAQAYGSIANQGEDAHERTETGLCAVMDSGGGRYNTVSNNSFELIRATNAS